MARHILAAYTDCHPGQEKVFNDWYKTEHVGDVLAVPGFIRAQRFESIPDMMGGLPVNRFLALYEFETDDPAATLADLLTAMRAMNIDASMDRTRTTVAAYAALGEARTAE